MGNWHLHGGELCCEAFENDLRAALAESQRIYLATTAFAPAHLLDATEERRLASHRRLQHRRGPAASNDARASCLEKNSNARARNRSGTNPAGIVAEHSFKDPVAILLDRLTEAGHSLPGKISPSRRRARRRSRSRDTPGRKRRLVAVYRPRRPLVLHCDPSRRISPRCAMTGWCSSAESTP